MKTIELVGYGHPDRFADYISESILVNALKNDKNSKVASEVMATKNMIFLGGEISTNTKLDYEKIVYDAIEKVYGEKWWPNYKSVKIVNNIQKQSSELSEIQSQKVVAGDQGVIYGYYSSKRYSIITYLYQVMDKIVKQFNVSPDWKLLFSDLKNEFSVSVCGVKKSVHKDIKTFVLNELKVFFKKEIDVIVNPKGEWLVGGPLSDTGLTGRKLMIDTFGAGIPHGGGAFCGKDFSKVDKTGVLIASEIAFEKFKNLGDQLEIFVELSYKIGDEKPNAYIYDSNNKLIENIKLDKTLNEWINNSDVFDVDWSEIVLKGGVIGYLSKKFNK